MNKHGDNRYLRVEILSDAGEQDRFHQDIELLYVLEGVIEVHVGKYLVRLPAEGIYVADGGKQYSYQDSEDVLFVRLTIPVHLVSQMTQSSNVIFWCDSTREDNKKHYDRLRYLLKQLLNRYLNIRGGVEDFGYLALCYQIMDELCTNFMLRITDKEEMDEKAQHEERIARINQYVNANYDRSISSRDLAEMLFLSQGYMSRFFKKYYNMSFAEYLTRVRLYHAVDDLVYTSLPITRIAFDNGFPNVAAFNKAFRDQYGDTPSARRKSMRRERQQENQEGCTTVLKGRLEEFLRQEGAVQEPSGKAACIEVNCSAAVSTILKNSWGDTVNIGSAAELLRSEVRDHVVILKNVLCFRYVRFWNIFSREMLIDPAAEPGTYNFSKLDAILDFLVAHDLKPHIELGMKPKRLYRTLQNAIVEEQESIFYNTEIWERFMHAMMSHLLRRYRRSELNTWRIEYWFYEKQLGQYEAYVRYFTVFSLIYRIVKEYAEALEVGGCGMRGDYIDLEDYGARFLQIWKNQPCQPDFISMGIYAYERGEVNQDRYSKRSTDNEAVFHYLNRMRDIMKQTGMDHLPLYITEWNLSLSDRNYINDSCFKGAYILKNVIDCYGSAKIMAYFLGSDRVSEHYDSNELLYGGCGLLSKDGLMKPAGYAYQFLKWLYTFYVGKGENYLVTTDQHDSYGIVCHNQKILNYKYYLSQEDQIERGKLWSYFEDRNPLELKLSLTDVRNGLYQVKTYLIDEEIGNPLRRWEELDYERELSRNDTLYLERVCGPKLTIQTLEARDHVLALDIRLAANELRFIRIRRIR